MAKAVVTTKSKPSYKDIPGVTYHFGRDLLERVMQALNDRIIFYEPRRSTTDLSSRGGRQAYFAVATIKEVRPDPAMQDHYFADLIDYLDFMRPVRFEEGGHYYESALQKEDGSTNKGKFGHSVRIVPDEEFEAILVAGFASLLPELALADEDFEDGLHEPLVVSRPLIETTTLKPFRAHAFRRSVRRAYGNQCAITGLAIVNGNGNPEVQAAHIRPVSDQGSDSVRNGLALTATAHWLFDQGLIGVASDMSIVVAKKVVPPKFVSLINEGGKINLPSSRADWPHPAFLAYHLDTYFKG